VSTGEKNKQTQTTTDFLFEEDRIKDLVWMHFLHVFVDLQRVVGFFSFL